MESIQGAWGGPRVYNAQIECGPLLSPQEVNTKTVGQALQGSHERVSREVEVGWGHKRSVLPRLVGQYYGGEAKEEEWEVNGLS